MVHVRGALEETSKEYEYPKLIRRKLSGILSADL
jgi:hypothetical protein